MSNVNPESCGTVNAQPENQISIADTIKAWAVVLAIITSFITVVAGSILYGWPKYQRYLAVERAKTEVAVDAVYDAAIASRKKVRRVGK